jgi:4-amino-4-deoxy-L-arabinose transferase-like glycosyltransferase
MTTSRRAVATWVRTYGLLCLIGMVVWGARSFDSDLRKDNVVYAAVSKELLSADNPLLLTLGGAPYLNKPPLFFWINAAFMRVLGPSVFSAKLPTILAGIGNLLLIFLLARRMTRDPHAAWWSVLVVLFTYGIMRCTNACRMENLLVLFLLLSLDAFLRYGEHRTPKWMLLAGLWIGLAALTKGPAALLPLAAYPLWAAVTDRRLLDPRGLAHLAAAAGVTALTCGWWFAYAARQTAFAEVFVEGQLLARFAQDAQDAAFPTDPLYTYLLMFLKSYAWFLPAVIVGARRLWRDSADRAPMLLYAVFLGLLLVAIHLLATKYDRYLLPAYLLLAVPAGAGIPLRWRPHGRRVVLVLALLFGMAVACIPIPFLHRHDFARLADVNAMAARAGLPIVVDPVFMSWWEQQAAAWFFLDAFQLQPPATRPYLEVRRLPDEQHPDPVLLETRYFLLYLRD